MKNEVKKRATEYIRELYKSMYPCPYPGMFRSEHEVPTIVVSSPLVGAILAPILANEKRPLTTKVIDTARRHAELFTAGKDKVAIRRRYRHALSHNNDSGRGASTSQPGGNTARSHRNTLAISWPTVEDRQLWNETNTASAALAKDTRDILHRAFKQRVRYHSCLTREEIARGMHTWKKLWPQELMFMWPNQRFVVVPEAPKILRNNNRQLHSTTQKAMQWPDGWGFYAVSGIRIPSHYVEKPETLTVEAIRRTDNVEIKRALIELMGYERWLKESEASRIAIDKDQDQRDRKLWNLDHQINVLEVFNSTPEPDGSYKKYFLQVPIHVKTIQTALSWMMDEGSRLNPKMRIET